MTDLTQFQVDLLTVLAGGGPMKGLRAMERLEDHYGQEINHGRLYPNLDTLAEKGLIQKSEHNRRSNHYDITKRGVRELESVFQFLHDNVAESYVIEHQSGGQITFRER